MNAKTGLKQLSESRRKFEAKRDLRLAVLASCGIAGPVLYMLQLIILGLLTPGYNHITDTMSILGGVGGIRATIFNTGLAVTGVLICLFAIGLHRGIKPGRGSFIGPLMLIIAGIGMVGAGYFHCDQGCENVLSFTFTGIMHSLTAFLTGVCASVAPLVIYLRLKNDPRWEKYRFYTLLSGLAANATGIGFWISLVLFRQEAVMFRGVLQRLGIVIPLLWMVIIAVQLLRVSRDRSTNELTKNDTISPCLM
ncbi:MAG: DUF998 domain-containing protein [Candidatus Odinarchaeota archaeon]